jgi:hypothetical protein
MMSAPNLSDTSTWLPLDGLAPGFDENKAELTTDIDGYSFISMRSDGREIDHHFTATTLSLSVVGGDGPDREVNYEAFTVADGLYYVQFQDAAKSSEAVSFFLDQTNGVGLVVNTIIGEASAGVTAVTQKFTTFTIGGHENPGSVPSPTDELIGRRVYWRYSRAHAYEHVYLSPQWYTWHCLAGPERGLADTEEHTTYKLRPDIYVFCWREKVIPCASVTVADHRDFENLRSHGVLFGLDESGENTVHFTFGSHGKVLSISTYPEDLDPRRQ